MSDMVQRDRSNHPIGEDNGRAKLDKDDVTTIRMLFHLLSKPKIAKLFGVSEQTIYNIHSGKTWKEHI